MIEASKVKVREIAPTLTNPGVPMNDSNTIVDEKEEVVEKNYKTMKDMEEVIFSFFN